MNSEKALRSGILSLLEQRSDGATICPSEAARRVMGDDWREHMETTRQVARRLAIEGRIEIRQRGAALDPKTPIRGPIRLGLPQARD